MTKNAPKLSEANITMLLSEFISVFIVRKYVDYDVSDYLLNVHLRCAIVLAVSFAIPYLIYNRFMEPSFLRPVLTCCITSISIIATVWAIGMNKDMRQKVASFIKSKLHRK